VPPLTPEGKPPPAPAHVPLGQEIDVPGDRSLYLLAGEPSDPRLIIYLHGMCGDIAAADYFREAVRLHGSLLALRGDTHCAGDRFKWRDNPEKMLTRLRVAVRRVNEVNGSTLKLEGALLFGYSQGADRAEKLAARFPRAFPRVVLGGPPVPPSPVKLARAERVAILGGELETTERMRQGFDALQAARIPSRFFTLECAYHGYFGTRAESQLLEVLDWVRGG
jgi:pimeloyl-ACP methyl ester carboxylesterase